MFSDLQEVHRFIRDEQIKFVDFKVIDLAGRWHHLTILAEKLTEETMQSGIGFDGSSYGFLTVEKSDMVFKPDLKTGFVDPFTEQKTLVFICNTYTLNPSVSRYQGDPRFMAEKAERYMQQSGIADTSQFGPEFEFNILDHFAYQLKPNHIMVELDAAQAEWNSGKNDSANLGFKTPHHGGYHADLPMDVNYNLRNEIVLLLESLDVPVKYHHSEVGGPAQLEIELSFDNSLKMADRSMILKYVVKNSCVRAGKTVTFMPKPFDREAGNGMHVHMHLFKDGQPIFYDEKGYSGLSQEGLYAIGGILTHAAALLAITNPSTNSYKRLVPGYEAPVSICFATANRSAVIRIPGYATEPHQKRFEFRSSDATCNPYLAYSALLMAMIDGIENQIDPTAAGFGPYDVNIFELPDEQKAKIKGLPKNLNEAADALASDHDFLLKGDVFNEQIISNILKYLRADAAEIAMVPHPLEYKKYFDL